MYRTKTVTQTATQARRLASRIGSELLQVQALYRRPSSEVIEKFIVEAELYLAAGYLDTVRYGFERNGLVIFELVYSATTANTIDDKPGRIPVDLDLAGSEWFSFLKQNSAWWSLSSSQREAFRGNLPLQRTFGEEPSLAPGIYSSSSKTFSEETLGLRREIRRI
jgi:hypothetical protein